MALTGAGSESRHHLKEPFPGVHPMAGTGRNTQLARFFPAAVPDNRTHQQHNKRLQALKVFVPNISEHPVLLRDVIIWEPQQTLLRPQGPEVPRLLGQAE